MLKDYERIDELEKRVLNLESEMNRILNQVDQLAEFFQDTLKDALKIIDELGDIISELGKKIPSIRSKFR